MNLFTYGTLQFSEVWQAVVGPTSRASPARAAGFTVRRVRDALYPGMASKAGGEVQGIVYFDLTASTIQRLDHFEGDQYTRQTIKVRLADGQPLTCEAYLVEPTELTNEPWTAEEFIARGDLDRFLGRYEGFAR